jgi:hypothetical protein
MRREMTAKVDRCRSAAQVCGGELPVPSVVQQ